VGALQGSSVRELLGQGREGGWLETQEKQGEARCPYVSRPAGPVSSSLGGSGMRLRGAWDFISSHDAASAGAGAAGVGVLVAYSPRSLKAPDSLALEEARVSLVRAAILMSGFGWVLSCVQLICTCSSPWQC